MLLEGNVISGKGEGAKFMKLPWVKKQIKEKLGFVPFPGTLDIRITRRSVNLKRTLRGNHGIQILPAAGFCRGKCFKSSFETELQCAVIIPEIIGYPEDLIEIVGLDNLREKFQLRDGDFVEVKVIF